VKKKPFHAPFEKLAGLKRALAEPPKAAPPPPPPPPAPPRERSEAELWEEATRGARTAVPGAGRVAPPAPRGAPEQVWYADLDALDELRALVRGDGPFDLSDGDEFIEGKVAGLDPGIVRKLRRGDYAVQGHLDLHGQTREEAKGAVERFLRDASGALVAVDQRIVNAGETVTEGIEVSVKGGFNAAGARWTAGLEGTYLLKKKSRVVSSAPWGASEVGQFTTGGDLGLRWKHNANISAKMGNWGATFSQTFRSGYNDQVLPGVASGLVSPPNWKPKVDSYTTYNLSATFTGIKGLTLTGLIKNVFDKDPPFAVTYDSNFGSGSSWEPRVADPRGRSFVLNVEYKFF
jgi:hypothetical protein